MGQEVEIILSQLPGNAVFRQMARRSFVVPGRALCPNAEASWSLLPLLVADSLCGRFEHVAPAAAAVEFLKVAADIFDDIEDQDNPDSLAAIYGEPQAINLASGLLVLGQRAMGRLRERGVDPVAILAVQDELASSFLKACAGQADDLSYQSGSGPSEEEYLQSVALKSASQLECACRIGALLATSDAHLIDCFGSFGHNLGMAAQITNDVQGIMHSGEGRGDIGHRRRTLPVIYALSYASGDARSTLEAAYAGEVAATPEIEEEVRAALFRVGAIHYSVVVAEVYRQHCLSSLEKARLAGANTANLREMIGQPETSPLDRT